MTTLNPTLTGLLQRLDARTATHARLDHYYRGTQPLAYLSPEARKAVGSRLGPLAVNVPRLTVTALAERLRVTGITGADVWADWLANDLDQLASVAHREALTLGRAYVIVWAHPDGSPSVSVESAHQVAVTRDPGTRQVTAAVKRWETATTTEATLFEPDQITRLRANHTGAVGPAFTTVEVLENPYGVVPVVELRNSDRLDDDGVSEMADVIPLVDALNKVLADMLTTSEFTARPRRWATGLELEEDEDGNAVNPIGEGDRLMVNESPDGKFGALPGADLAPYSDAVTVLTSQIMSVSSLPSHYLGVLSSQPPSADSLRAAEASLVAKAEARMAAFGRAWEQVARLMAATRTGLDPASVDARVTWADPATRSVAQEADAVVKLHTAGLLPTTYALARLGYTDTQISEIRAARRAEALDTVGTSIEALVS